MADYKFSNSLWITGNVEDKQLQWGCGVSHRVAFKGELCRNGCIHFYEDEILAVLMDVVDAEYMREPGHILWRGRASGQRITNGLKSGCERFTTIEPIEVPVVSAEQRIGFAILCSLELPQSQNHVEWAADWLSGADRTQQSACAARAMVPEGNLPALLATKTAVFSSRSAQVTAARTAISVALTTRYSNRNIDFIGLAHKAMEVVGRPEEPGKELRT